MRKLTTTVCITIAVLLGCVHESWSADKSGDGKARDNSSTTTVLVIVRDLKELTTYERRGTRTRADYKVYVPTEGLGRLERRLSSAFNEGGFESIPYRDVAEFCDGPKYSRLEASFAKQESVPAGILQAAFKAIRRCEINYLIVVTLTLDSLSEMEKGRVIYRGAARAYDVSRSIARTIGLAYFDGRSSGETKYSIERAIFEEVTAKLAGGEIAGNKKADNGVFLQTMRKKLGIIQRD